MQEKLLWQKVQFRNLVELILIYCFPYGLGAIQKIRTYVFPEGQSWKLNLGVWVWLIIEKNGLPFSRVTLQWCLVRPFSLGETRGEKGGRFEPFYFDRAAQWNVGKSIKHRKNDTYDNNRYTNFNTTAAPKGVETRWCWWRRTRNTRTEKRISGSHFAYKKYLTLFNSTFLQQIHTKMDVPFLYANIFKM